MANFDANKFKFDSNKFKRDSLQFQRDLRRMESEVRHFQLDWQKTRPEIERINWQTDKLLQDAKANAYWKDQSSGLSNFQIAPNFSNTNLPYSTSTSRHFPTESIKEFAQGIIGISIFLGMWLTFSYGVFLFFSAVFGWIFIVSFGASLLVSIFLGVPIVGFIFSFVIKIFNSSQQQQKQWVSSTKPENKLEEELRQSLSKLRAKRLATRRYI